jgi:Acetyl xylan esterase (AXE1)
MHLVSLLVAGIVVIDATAQICPRPEPPPGGFATQVDLLVPVSYSDGYQTFGSLIRPQGPAPTCGWPLLVHVHPLGQGRGFDLPLQLLLAGQGYAVWSYDVRGQGQALAANAQHPAAGTALWGPVERADLAEQILFVGGNAAWVGAIDAGRVAVIGSSQGGGHAWHAAAWSGLPLQVPGRTVTAFPLVKCAVAYELVPDAAGDWLRGGQLFSSWFVDAISGSYAGVQFDPAFVQTCRTAFLAQDPASLLPFFAGEGRDLGPRLAASTVPVLFAHAWFDTVCSPLSAVVALESMSAPYRALLGTVGHGSAFNEGERQLRTNLTLRWLHRHLWEIPNEVDGEQRLLLAELPLAAALRDDPQHAWSHTPTDAVTPPAGSERLYLHDDAALRQLPPSSPQLDAVIQQAIDPLATTFNPTDYLAQAALRDLPAVLAACPLQERVWSYTLAAEAQLAASPRLHLRVVPHQPAWMLAALLTVQPAEPGAAEVLLSSAALAVRTSTALVAETHELRLPPIAARLPAGATVRLRLRNMWVRAAPMPVTLEAAPLFHDFRVDVVHGDPIGTWLDLPLQPVEPRLVAEDVVLELATAAPAVLRLRGGAGRASYPFFATVGLSGQQPGIPYLNDIVPIEGDWLVVASAGSMEPPYYGNFLGWLDAAGEATVTFDLSSIAPLPQVLNGLQFTFAAFVWDGSWAPTGAASNPCDVMLR